MDRDVDIDIIWRQIWEDTEMLKQLMKSYSLKVFFIVLYSLILVTGVVGNVVTVRVTRVLLRNGYLQRSVTDHMVSLACSDLLVLIIGMPVELYIVITVPFNTMESPAFCQLYFFMYQMCSYATILNVATLSFERYMAICHPFKFKALTARLACYLIIFSWVMSVLVALPLLFAMESMEVTFQLEEGPVELTFCTVVQDRWRTFQGSVLGAFIVYMVVLVSVGVMCRRMILVLQKPMGPIGGGANGAEGTPKHESLRVKTARKQTILFLGLIVGALTVCWIPTQVNRLMVAAVPKWIVVNIHSMTVFNHVATILFFLSSAINPFLYNISSPQFRQVFLQVLRCRLTIQHINKRTLRPEVNSQGQTMATTNSIDPPTTNTAPPTADPDQSQSPSTPLPRNNLPSET